MTRARSWITSASLGDASDNIRGAKGIGPKTAAAMLNIFGNLDDVYRAIDDVTDGLKPSQVTSLEELRQRLDSVRALVTMRTDVPLDVAAVFKPRVPKVAEEFMEDEMDEQSQSAHLQSLRALPTGTDAYTGASVGARTCFRGRAPRSFHPSNPLRWSGSAALNRARWTMLCGWLSGCTTAGCSAPTAPRKRSLSTILLGRELGYAQRWPRSAASTSSRASTASART